MHQGGFPVFASIPPGAFRAGVGLMALLAGSGSAAARAREATASLPVRVLSAATATATETITIDGQLDDEVWAQMTPVGGFRQREPREGDDPSFPTDVRVAHDARALYVAVRAHDPDPSRIIRLRTRRDTASPSDWIRILIDSWHDRRTAFEFAVNAAGVRQDRYWFNDHNNDAGWDAVWDVAVAIDDRGWSAEFRIPLSQLRYTPRPDARFGFAVVRHIGRLNETSSWPLLPRSAQGYVSSFGDLSGLRLAAAANRLELVPYAVASLDTQPREAGNPLVDPRDPGGRAGLDFKYAVTPGITLTGTVNPDFGQVEADPAVVNLSAFETFFAERRPFFLEGSGIFRFDLDCEDDRCTGLFYSRRVGRQPRGDATVAEPAHSSAPVETTILGATKLTGRVGSWTFGAIAALTADERATVIDGGVRSRPFVESATSYSVARIRREWTNQSSVGAMFTAANRRVPIELRDVLASQAYAGGIDVDWRLSPRYKIGGHWAASRVSGDAGAIEALQSDARHFYQRPDAAYVTFDPSRTSLTGQAGLVSFGKTGGEFVRSSSTFAFRTPGFEINEVGFLRRADERRMSNWIQFRRDRPSRLLRSVRLNLNQWGGWNYGNDRIGNGGNVNIHFTLHNNWGTGFGLTRQGRTLDDRLTRGGPGGYRDPRWTLWSYVESDPRRTLSSNVFVLRAQDPQGGASWQVSPALTARPSSALSVSVDGFFAGNRDPAQWVAKVDADPGQSASHYVFGRLTQQTTAVAFRINYAATSTLSLQLYGRPFVSNGDYASYRELVDGRAGRFEDRYRASAYAGDADFRFRSFRMTNVLRWEYRPGSTVFVVWQQGRDTDALTSRGARDVWSAFAAPARNVFLVKLAYWVNL